MDSGRVEGFECFCDEHSEVLILGSFPSVKSRQVEFFYGNPQNAFWKILSNYFGENLPITIDEKKLLLTYHHIALWDVVESCEIVGSSDSAIKNYKVIDLPSFLAESNIKTIFLNGGKASSIYKKYFGYLPIKYFELPSTSPANTRRNDEIWFEALSKCFG
jgi:hypoxanthine-DNA glycosylase